MTLPTVADGGRETTDDVAASLRAIRRWNGDVGAFTEVFDDAAHHGAAARGGALAGVPVAVKELFDVEGADGSYGSTVLAGRRGPADAAVVASLRSEGAVIVGLTRAHEFGWGITTQHGRRGSTRNPWDLARIPGGSSGGSAAAVASGMVPLAVASDTGGSIRIPASFCGVFGLKTTPGRISRRGGVALAPSFDTVGFVADRPALLGAALAATCGADAADPITLEAPPLATASLTVADLRVGVADWSAHIATSPERSTALEAVVAALVGLGATRVPVDVPDGRTIYDIFVPLQMAEAYHVHHVQLGTYPERADDYGPDVRHRLELAERVSLADYLAARSAAGMVKARLLLTLQTVDVLASLVSPCAPGSIDSPNEVDIDGRSMPLRDAVMPSTVPQNVAGLPSVTVPAGFDADGLPIGVQLTGPPWSEPTLIAVAEALEHEGVSRTSISAAFQTDE